MANAVPIMTGCRRYRVTLSGCIFAGRTGMGLWLTATDYIVY
ncbi:hypothetical protein [Secundilactobacillus collinoides]|nr:hypothetical protein [Secundilactobacillus collinoides]